MSERKRWIVMITVSVLIAVGFGTLIFLQHKKIDEREFLRTSRPWQNYRSFFSRRSSPGSSRPR